MKYRKDAIYVVPISLKILESGQGIPTSRTCNWSASIRLNNGPEPQPRWTMGTSQCKRHYNTSHRGNHHKLCSKSPPLHLLISLATLHYRTDNVLRFLNNEQSEHSSSVKKLLPPRHRHNRFTHRRYMIPVPGTGKSFSESGLCQSTAACRYIQLIRDWPIRLRQIKSCYSPERGKIDEPICRIDRSVPTRTYVGG